MIRNSYLRMRKAIPFVVSAVLIVYVLRNIDLDRLASGLVGIPLWALVAISSLAFLNIAVTSLRLTRLLSHFGAFTPWRTALRASISGLLSSLLMFSLVGAILGRQFVLRRGGVSVSTVALLTTYERLVLALVGGSCFIAGAIYLMGREAFVGALEALPLAQMLAAIAIASAIVFRLSRSGFERRLLRKLYSSSNISRFLEIGGLTLLGQFVTFCTFVVALSTQPITAGFTELLAAAAIVSFAASLPISINGWGIREVAAAWVFGHLGLPAENAVAVSVLVGLLSTAAVLVSGLILLLPAKASLQGSASSEPPARHGSQPAQTMTRILALVLPLTAGLLLFFQVRLPLADVEVTANLADPVALIALAVVAVFAFTSQPVPIRLHRPVVWWMAGVSLLIGLGFLIGVARFDVTAWALNNRLLGWLVILGFFSLGCLISGSLGRHGLRRLCETLVSTAAVVTLFNLALHMGERLFGLYFALAAEFEGFSTNRNTFAFQLLIALCCAISLSRPCAKLSRRARLWPLLTGIILFGLWQTSSKTGLIVLIVLLALSYSARLADRRFLLTSIAAGFAVYGAVWILPFLIPDHLLRPNADELSRGMIVVYTRDLAERWYSLEAGFRLWLEHPIFGAGLGAFMHREIAADGVALVIHSTPVWLLAEFGVIGLVFVGLLPLYGIYVLAIRFRERTEPRTALIITVAVTFCVFCLAHDIFYQRIFWLVLGAGLAGFDARMVRRRSPTRPIRVTHVITSLNRGGAETMLLGLMRAGDGSVRPNVVSLISDGALTEAIKVTGTSVHELGFRSGLPNPVGILKLARLIRYERPDIVQGWMYHGDLVALIGLLLSGRRREVALIWGIRCSDMDLSRYGWRLKLVVAACTRLSAWPEVVTANSEAGRQTHLKLGYRPRRFEVVHNGIDTDRFKPAPERRAGLRQEFGIPAGARVILQVARVDPMKNYEGLMDAVSKVDGIWLVMVGRGTDALPRQDRVVALGLRGDVDQILAVGDAIVSASGFGEGFSNALAEGMASGLVPVATDVGDSRLLADPVGWCVPASDPDALEAALRAVRDLSEEELLARKLASRNRIADDFGLNVVVERFSDLYRRTLFEHAVSESGRQQIPPPMPST